MGTIAHLEESVSVPLNARHLVGRAAACDLRLDDDMSVSGEHAVLNWTGTLWTVQDLGSRNGTFLNGERLPLSTAYPVRVGDMLMFGRKQTWVVKDVSRPGDAPALERTEAFSLEKGPPSLESVMFGLSFSNL